MRTPLPGSPAACARSTSPHLTPRTRPPRRITTTRAASPRPRVSRALPLPAPRSPRSARGARAAAAPGASAAGGQDGASRGRRSRVGSSGARCPDWSVRPLSATSRTGGRGWRVRVGRGRRTVAAAPAPPPPSPRRPLPRHLPRPLRPRRPRSPALPPLGTRTAGAAAAGLSGPRARPSWGRGPRLGTGPPRGQRAEVRLLGEVAPESARERDWGPAVRAVGEAPRPDSPEINRVTPAPGPRGVRGESGFCLSGTLRRAAGRVGGRARRGQRGPRRRPCVSLSQVVFPARGLGREAHVCAAHAAARHEAEPLGPGTARSGLGSTRFLLFWSQQVPGPDARGAGQTIAQPSDVCAVFSVTY